MRRRASSGKSRSRSRCLHNPHVPQIKHRRITHRGIALTGTADESQNGKGSTPGLYSISSSVASGRPAVRIKVLAGSPVHSLVALRNAIIQANAKISRQPVVAPPAKRLVKLFLVPTAARAAARLTDDSLSGHDWEPPAGAPQGDSSAASKGLKVGGGGAERARTMSSPGRSTENCCCELAVAHRRVRFNDFLQRADLRHR